jgi:hypothetical protein
MVSLTKFHNVHWFLQLDNTYFYPSCQPIQDFTAVKLLLVKKRYDKKYEKGIDERISLNKKKLETAFGSSY